MIAVSGEDLAQIVLYFRDQHLRRVTWRDNIEHDLLLSVSTPPAAPLAAMHYPKGVLIVTQDGNPVDTP